MFHWLERAPAMGTAPLEPTTKVAGQNGERDYCCEDDETTGDCHHRDGAFWRVAAAVAPKKEGVAASLIEGGKGLLTG